jgi:hypothetical protein
LSQHPQIMVQIEVMKTEVITYQTPADSINPLVERKDDNGQDTFDISNSPGGGRQTKNRVFLSITIKFSLSRFPVSGIVFRVPVLQ